jgi:sirohydrochlorin ferrochelatase
MSEFQRMRERELALDRRELAEMLLSGQMGTEPVGGYEQVRSLARNVGLERYPDRVLVLRLQTAMEESFGAIVLRPRRVAELGGPKAIGGNLALARVAHLIEDRCQSWPNTLATVVTPGEMCIFTAQRSRTAGNERLLLEEMAQTLLRIARAGISAGAGGHQRLHQQSTELLRAYHEAASALESGHSTVNCLRRFRSRKAAGAGAGAGVEGFATGRFGGD